jgi:hypothetical protein
MIEEVLGLEHLRMTPVKPAEQIFPGPTRPNADLSERRLECCVVPKAALAERLLDGVVKVVALELRDPPALSPHTRARRKTSPSLNPAPTSTGMNLMRGRSSSRTYSSGVGRGSPNAT